MDPGVLCLVRPQPEAPVSGESPCSEWKPQVAGSPLSVGLCSGFVPAEPSGVTSWQWLGAKGGPADPDEEFGSGSHGGEKLSAEVVREASWCGAEPVAGLRAWVVSSPCEERYQERSHGCHFVPGRTSL